MTLPGVPVIIGESLTNKTLPSSTGTAFIVGLADRGPVDKAVPILSLAQYVSVYGDRVSYGTLYDTLDIAFREELNQAYVVRTVGPAAVTASKNLANAAAENTLEVKAASPGEWGNSIKVEVLAGAAGNFKLKVFDGEDLAKASPELADNTAAVAWAAASASSYIVLKDLGKGDPKTEQSVTLASGADDRENVTTKIIEEGLALFTPDLGPGQVAAPGNVAEAVQSAVIAHCNSTQRVAYLDAEDTAKAEDMIAAVAALRSLTGAHQGAMFGPWDIAPGTAQGTTRTVAPVARQLGAAARVDAAAGNASVPAAGDEGKAQYVTEVANTYTDADLESLNDAGVNISIMDGGVPTTYGWRTLADPVEDSRWLPLNVARVMTSIAYEAKAVLKRYMFKRTDAGGKTRAAAEGAVRNEVLKPLYVGEALYGATEADAYTVTVSQEVNPTDGSVAKLTAEVGAAPVKFAEQIPLTVVATN